MEEMAEIPVSRLNELLDSEMKLIALEGAGVDNWQGYEDAMDAYREMLEDEAA